MATPLPDAPFVLPSVVFRPARLALLCLVLAAVAIGLAFIAGAGGFGVFFSIGLFLGLTNALLVRASVATITAQDHPLKRRVALNSATRLLLVTAIALVIAFAFRPFGFGVLFGLAVFQVVLVLSTVVPVWMKMRKGDWEYDGPDDSSESTGRAPSAGPSVAE
jgi:hypothetical protein